MKRIELESPVDFLDWRQGSGKTVEIFDIVVGTKRREGRGRRLIDALLAEVPADTCLVWAITRSTNFIAQQFYEGLGFRVVAPLRDFYRDSPVTHADAIMYGLDIARSNQCESAV